MTFSLTSFLAQYGYLAVFAGSVAEGETILLLAGFAAHQGYMSFPLAVACGFLGGLAGDQAFFYLGRRHGPWLMRRFPSVGTHVRRVDALIARYRSLVVVMVRFLYGLRAAGPVVLGMSGMSPWRFAALNALGALVWAFTVCGAGYAFGQAMNSLLGDLRRYEEAALVMLACAGLIALYWRGRRARLARQRERSEGDDGK